MKILFVEDESALSASFVAYFTKEGHICETAQDFAEASEKIHLYSYDIIVVDIGLPDGNGLDLLREAKEGPTATGVIIVSARDSLEDKLHGLGLGADDYITKPFHLAELNARFASLIRRINFKGRRAIHCREIEVVPEAKEVRVKGKLLALTRKEYELLLYFLSNRNRVVTKESIAEHLWGDNMDMADSLDFIYTHIKNLRRKIQAEGGRDYVKTIYGIGYKFTEGEE